VPPDVVAEGDFAGSTSAMIDYVVEEAPPKVVLLTECSMSRQHLCREPGYRVPPPVQSLPAHEAHHAAKGKAACSSACCNPTIPAK
jgi:quinolinate synthase